MGESPPPHPNPSPPQRGRGANLLPSPPVLRGRGAGGEGALLGHIKLGPAPGQKYSCRALSSMPRKKSSPSTAMNEYTNASVEARPTPSAPPWLLNPRWQLTSAMAAPKNNGRITPANVSHRL